MGRDDRIRLGHDGRRLVEEPLDPAELGRKIAKSLRSAMVK